MKNLLIILSVWALSIPVFACESGHWIKSKSSDGSVVVLEDNSVWEIDVVDRIDSTLWLSSESITVCINELINSDTGDKVGATQLS